MHTLVTFAETHPVWSMLVLVSTATAFSLLQRIPGALWRVLVRTCTVQLEIDGANPSFKLFEQWIARHASAGSASTYVVHVKEDRMGISPGFGTHLFWQPGFPPCTVSRVHKDVKSENMWDVTPKETIVISMFGLKSRSRKALQNLIDELYGEHQTGRGLAVRAWHFGYWYPLTSRINRPLSTVVLPAEQKQEIVDCATWFFDNQAWFVATGVPYRNGFLFLGAPGCGKSSMICGLGTHFDRPVCMLSLTAVSNDNDLLNAFIQAPKNAIIAIEDVDAMRATAVRQGETNKADDGEVAIGIAGTPPQPAPEIKGVTLSGLLNAIDGVAAPEGRLLILTTNHPEKLDPALIRKARIDKEFTFGPLTPDLVEEMAQRFFPDDPAQVQAIRSKADLGPDRPAADWQGEFMDRRRQQR